MIRRILLLVLNGLGVGALPEAPSSASAHSERVPDSATDTLARLLTAHPDLRLPHLEALGLGHLTRHPRLIRLDQPDGCFGRIARQAPGSDAMGVYWELAGMPVETDIPSYAAAVPADVLRVIEQIAQRPIVQSTNEVLDEIVAVHGAHGFREKGLVVWGEEGAACNIAAHESILPPKDLFRLVREVRTATGALGVRRVGARPYAGGAGEWRWRDGWRESCRPVPSKSLFDYLNGAVQLVTSFGKCGDYFNASGFTRSMPVDDTATAWTDMVTTLKTTPRGLIVVNLFDDVPRAPRANYGAVLADQLHEVDTRIPALQAMLKPEDVVLITSDQTRDLQCPERLVREYAPLLVFGPKVARGVNLGTRATYADLGQTIADALAAPELSVGESFVPALRAG